MKGIGVFIAALTVLLITYGYNKLKHRPKNRTNLHDNRWHQNPCSCGSSRDKWKPIDMNRLELKLLLYCPVCGCLWEEKMSPYGNAWRQVDEDYARANFKEFSKFTVFTQKGR